MTPASGSASVTVPDVPRLSTAQAAAKAGMAVSSFRGMVARARKQGIELQAPQDTWPDARTPMYDERKLTNFLARRPGPGNWAK